MQLDLRCTAVWESASESSFKTSYRDYYHRDYESKFFYYFGYGPFSLWDVFALEIDAEPSYKL